MPYWKVSLVSVFSLMLLSNVVVAWTTSWLLAIIVSAMAAWIAARTIYRIRAWRALQVLHAEYLEGNTDCMKKPLEPKNCEGVQARLPTVSRG